MTEWRAIRSVTTAFDKTKRLLLEPFNLWVWLKLVIIVFFAGTIGTRYSNIGNQIQYRFDKYSEMQSMISAILSDRTLLYIAIALIVAIVILALVFGYLRSVFSFVFIHALATGDVRVIKPALENLNRGLRLFVFNILASLFTIIISVLIIAMIAISIFTAINMSTSSVTGIAAILLLAGLSIVLFLVLIAFILLMSIIIGFTFDFIAPYMYFKNMKLLEAWSHLYAIITDDWKQFGLYIIARWILEIVLSIALMVIMLPFFILILVLIVLAVLAMGFVWKVSILLSLFIAFIAAIFTIIAIIALYIISMPVAVYLRYYSLDMLRYTDSSAVIYSDRIEPGGHAAGQ